MSLRHLSCAGLLALACTAPGWAQTPTPAVPAVPATPAAAPAAHPAAALLGRWQVDLRPSPESPPYLQDFVVTRVLDDQSFEGTFYGTPITQARINTRWGAVRIAFTTADGAGPYHHSAVLRDGRMEGLTHAPGRALLAYWSASR